MSTKRLQKELREVNTHADPPTGITAVLPSESNLRLWHVTLPAPPDSPYHPGTFGLTIAFPLDYPFKAPTVRFATRIYHPNVTDELPGAVCLGMLKPENWAPTVTVPALLAALRQLLAEPNPDDPLEERIAREYVDDRDAFDRKASQYVQKYAMGPPDFGTPQ